MIAFCILSKLILKKRDQNMSNLYKPFFLLLISGTIFTSCKKSDYTPPTTPTSAVYTNELKDDFNSDTHNWSFVDPINAVDVFINNGMLYFTSHPNGTGINLSVISTSINPKANFRLESSLLSDNVMGLSFGANDTSNGFSFKIDQNGNFAVINEGSTGAAMVSVAANPVINWNFCSNISKGLMNTLAIEQIGSTWVGSINNTQVFSTTARPVLGSKVGFIISRGTNGQADYLDVKW